MSLQALQYVLSGFLVGAIVCICILAYEQSDWFRIITQQLWATIRANCYCTFHWDCQVTTVNSVMRDDDGDLVDGDVVFIGVYSSNKRIKTYYEPER